MKDNILQRFEKALREDDFEEMQAVVSELNSLKPSEKKPFVEIYRQINERLFEKNYEINNIDLEGFEKSAKESGTKSPALIKGKVQEIHDGADVLTDFLTKTGPVCKYIKAHFLFLLDNASVTATEIIILTDNTFYDNPLIQRIIEKFDDGRVRKITLTEFIAECKTNPSVADSRFVCLIALPTSLLHEQRNKDALKELFSIFKSSEEIRVSKVAGEEPAIFRQLRVTEDTLEYIENICSKVFNNRDITFEEEIIIKSFFTSSTPIIDYKILKVGFSGSKVIEAQPIKSMSHQTARFVIKYAKKDGKRKIKKEKEAFQEFIDDFSVHGYKAEYRATLQYEGIKYAYASNDSRSDSFSFAQLMEMYLKTGKTNFSLPVVLQQLFNCEPFQLWTLKSKKMEVVEELYKDYVDSAKLLVNSGQILGVKTNEVPELALWKDYQQISRFRSQTYMKVCHGDLHTENFFKDNDGVYLIDFGYTANRPAVLDYATLEASLRFKHIPFYISVDELIQIEEQLTVPDSFNTNYNLDFITRPQLKEIFGLVVQCRVAAAPFLIQAASPLDYWISLYIISIRQINYRDLNQRYALDFAEMLSRKIVKIINAGT